MYDISYINDYNRLYTYQLSYFLLYISSIICFYYMHTYIIYVCNLSTTIYFIFRFSHHISYESHIKYFVPNIIISFVIDNLATPKKPMIMRTVVRAIRDPPQDSSTNPTLIASGQKGQSLVMQEFERVRVETKHKFGDERIHRFLKGMKYLMRNLGHWWEGISFTPPKEIVWRLGWFCNDPKSTVRKLLFLPYLPPTGQWGHLLQKPWSFATDLSSNYGRKGSSCNILKSVGVQDLMKTILISIGWKICSSSDLYSFHS